MPRTLWRILAILGILEAAAAAATGVAGDRFDDENNNRERILGTPVPAPLELPTYATFF